MAERTEDVQAHWTRPGVLARIDAALTELGHDPQNLSPEILATLDHLHSGGLATTRRQAYRIADITANHAMILPYDANPKSDLSLRLGPSVRSPRFGEACRWRPRRNRAPAGLRRYAAP